MFYHNLKLAFRNLSRHKTFSTINILGFTIGLTSFILIGLYVFNELSYDRFHKNHTGIFRINKKVSEKGKDMQRDAITPGQLAPALEKEVPEITRAARFRPWFNDMLISYDSIHIKLPDVAYADQSFLDIFDFTVTAGNAATALADPYTAVMTESSAKKYFGNSDPLGKVVTTLNDIPVKITAVVKDIPHQSSLQFSMLISWSSTTTQSNAAYFSWMNNWMTQVDFTFVSIKPGTSPLAIGGKINAVLARNLPEKRNEYNPYLQPLDEIHLSSSGLLFGGEFRTSSRRLIYTLMIIAGVILLIACFNFINLSTAAALNRAKETGMEKVLGASQFQLIVKFFTESYLLCTLSMGLAIMFVIMVLPAFNNLTGAGIDPSILSTPLSIAVLIGLLLFISVAAGLQPAVYLSRFKSTDVFRNAIRGGKNSFLRQSLVTIQFTLSILLIISTLVVNKQMKYLSTKDLGFDKEQVVVLQITNTGVENSIGQLKTALLSGTGVVAATVTNRVPSHSFNGYDIVPEGSKASDHLVANVLETDADFVHVYNIKVLEGRYFSPQLKTDTANAIVINEAMCRYLNWKDPIGKSFEVMGARKGKVIGVVRDFNSTTLREAVQPLAMILNNNPLYLSIKLKPSYTEQSLDFVKKTWKQFAPNYPLEFFFMDERMNDFYKSDSRLLQVLTLFAGLAILIASMGLFGLSIYAARQRTKEIGIRKVLGATVADITTLLSKDFLKLIVVAGAIAFPCAWWIMTNWLQEFAYRINIGWAVFLFAGIITLAIALSTVSYQAIKAALANPVKSLRAE